MTLPALPTGGPFSPAMDSSGESAAVLGNLTAALARGELAQGTQLMEHALLLNVQWEQLTTAVHDGIAQGYELPKDTRETR
jgi:hypothetical protein